MKNRIEISDDWCVKEKKEKRKKTPVDKKQKNKEYCRKYYEKNKQKVKKRALSWYEKNKEKQREHKREYASEYYKKNKEKIIEQHVKYNEKKKLKVLKYEKQLKKIKQLESKIYKKEYYRKNKEKYKKYYLTYKNKKALKDGVKMMEFLSIKNADTIADSAEINKTFYQQAKEMLKDVKLYCAKMTCEKCFYSGVHNTENKGVCLINERENAAREFVRQYEELYCDPDGLSSGQKREGHQFQKVYESEHKPETTDDLMMFQVNQDAELIKEKDAEIRKQNDTIKELLAKIAEVEEKAQLEKRYFEESIKLSMAKDVEISELKKEISKRDTNSFSFKLKDTSLAKQIKHTDDIIDNLNERIQHKDEEIKQLKEQLTSDDNRFEEMFKLGDKQSNKLNLLYDELSTINSENKALRNLLREEIKNNLTEKKQGE